MINYVFLSIFHPFNRSRSVNSRVEGGPESPGATCESRDHVRHQTTIHAVRNTLLALTDQPLVVHNPPAEPPKPIPSGGSLRTLPDSVDSTGCNTSHLTIATPTSANKRSPRTTDYVKLGILANRDVSPSRISRDTRKEVEPPLGNKMISWSSSRCGSAGPPQDNLHYYGVDCETSPGFRRQRSPISREIAIPDTDLSLGVGATKIPTENGKVPGESSGEAVPLGGVCGSGNSPSDAANLGNADGGIDDRSWPIGVQEVTASDSAHLRKATSHNLLCFVPCSSPVLVPQAVFTCLRAPVLIHFQMTR